MKQEFIKIEGGSCICTFYHNGKANVMIIDSVEVIESQRRRGIGTKLITRCLELAKERNVDSVELTVNPDNLPAKKLYQKMGFKKTTKEYYRVLL